MSAYVRVERGAGHRAGQFLQHESDPRRWQVRVFPFRDEKGRKRYRTEVVHGRKRDTEARLLDLLQIKSTGTRKPRHRMTVRELVKEWSDHKQRDVAPRTLAQYRRKR